MATNASTKDKKPPPTTVFPFPIRTNAITDDYEVLSEVLGVGVSGKVYKCQHRTSTQQCALKILSDSDKARREVIMHKKACENCPYIVQVLDVYQNKRGANRCLLIVMERMEGGELYNRIKRRSTNPYTERDAARFIRMVVHAVAHLHTMDIAHRDLKLENLLFTTKEADAILKLSDFGFAKEGHNEQQPLTTPWCYTPYYVAPEILSRGRYDEACDIWSLGVIMYILLSGAPPFYSVHGDNISDGMKRKIRAAEYQFEGEVWQKVSEEAKSTIKRMLIVDPAQRLTIDEILKCAWLSEPASDRPIDVSSLRDAENWDQIQTELKSANDFQRRVDDDVPLVIRGPEASRVQKRRAAKEREMEAKK